MPFLEDFHILLYLPLISHFHKLREYEMKDHNKSHYILTILSFKVHVLIKHTVLEQKVYIATL